MEVQHDEHENNGMFFIDMAGRKVASMVYSVRDGKIVIEHTMVDESLRGKDIGIKLVNEVVNFSRNKKMKIIAECTYAKKVLESGTEYKDELAV